MKKQRIAVLFGGVSSEHDVSRISASTIIEHLNQERYEVVCIGITKAGRFLYYRGEVEAIRNGTWEEGIVEDCVISCNRELSGILILRNNGYEVLPVDVVFPVLHGKNGEDGTIQGLLQLAKLPFVGCDAISSANCMDKEMTHIVLERAGVRMASWVAVKASDAREEAVAKAERILSYPMFIKPANAGSSFGVSKAHNREELLNGFTLAFEHDDKAVVEETIIGREVECAVLGNDKPRTSFAGEIEPANEFYDYEAKYVNAESKLHIPARISDEAMQTLRDAAVQAYCAIGCSGLSRVDFFVTAEEEIILNEINTLPGFTSISMYPKMWEASGISITELLDHLITYALEKH